MQCQGRAAIGVEPRLSHRGANVGLLLAGRASLAQFVLQASVIRLAGLDVCQLGVSLSSVSLLPITGCLLVASCDRPQGTDTA
ncbi:hypothetical protein ODI_R1859 [Orrella dioscoreae]|uniref:Uncharacterized protein n=1 Tax=Orrella dioscoreae TaxID=1851544 RepID=A0A1C3K1D7_9BURK|nr:hypothetical protein ODI_03636 [Orrella dioscoreae]SOE49127.1 hypothetical protein ODI_R1859 [Orrella dioscoreae]